MLGVLETIPVEKAKQLFDVNFFGVLRTIQAVLPYMKKRRSGLILNNSSLFGLVGAPFNELYCAAKFALEGLTESLAPTLLFFDIRLGACLRYNNCLTNIANRSFFKINFCHLSKFKINGMVFAGTFTSI